MNDEIPSAEEGDGEDSEALAVTLPDTGQEAAIHLEGDVCGLSRSAGGEDFAREEEDVVQDELPPINSLRSGSKSRLGFRSQNGSKASTGTGRPLPLQRRHKGQLRAVLLYRSLKMTGYLSKCLCPPTLRLPGDRVEALSQLWETSGPLLSLGMQQHRRRR